MRNGRGHRKGVDAGGDGCARSAEALIDIRNNKNAILHDSRGEGGGGGGGGHPSWNNCPFSRTIGTMHPSCMEHFRGPHAFVVALIWIAINIRPFSLVLNQHRLYIHVQSLTISVL